MSFLLTNTALLPFLLLIAAPLLIHLFAKGHPPLRKFSSVDFIMRIVKESMRVKRPQDYLLLLLRTLLFALLILLFLQPLLFNSPKAASVFSSDNIVVVVDSTASMSLMEGAQSRFAAACAEASELLSGLGDRDRGNVVWLKSSPSSVFPEMGVNFSFLKDSLRKAKVTSEAGDIPGAIRLAASLLGASEGRRQICLISDFQKSAWGKLTLDIPKGIELIKIKIGKEDAANLGVRSFRCEPAKPIVGDDVSFYCEVMNYSAQARKTTVYFNAQESRDSRELSLPAHGSGTLLFKHKFSSHGIFPVKLSISEDNFPGDDSRFLCVQVAQSLSVGIASGSDPATAKVWRKALESLGWAKVEELTEKDLSSDISYDVLMLAGWNGEAAAKIEGRLKKGQTIVCLPADGLDLGKLPGLSGIGRLEKSQERSHKIKIAAVKDAVFKLFEGGDSVDPVSGSISARILLPDLGKDAKVLLAYDDGSPALARFKHGGTLLIWCQPLGRDYGTWQMQPGFLPFLSELLLSAREDIVDGALPEFCPGDSLVFKIDGAALASDITLRDESGKDLSVEQRREGDSVSFVSKPIAEPGVYFWRDRGRDALACAVNFPIVESDLASISASEALRSQVSLSVAGGGDVKRMREGIELWPFLLLLGVLLLLSEGVVASWAGRS